MLRVRRTVVRAIATIVVVPVFCLAVYALAKFINWGAAPAFTKVDAFVHLCLANIVPIAIILAITGIVAGIVPVSRYRVSKKVVRKKFAYCFIARFLLTVLTAPVLIGIVWVILNVVNRTCGWATESLCALWILAKNHIFATVAILAIAGIVNSFFPYRNKTEEVEEEIEEETDEDPGQN